MLELIGGPDRDRTGDLFHAMEARSQLRHRPTLGRTRSILRPAAHLVKLSCMVRSAPLRPPASTGAIRHTRISGQAGTNLLLPGV
jgi:hypothetical protein